MELQMQALQYLHDRSMHSRGDGRPLVATNALHMYRSALRRGGLRRWWSALTRRPHSLLALNRSETTSIVRGSYSVGVCAVPIRQILGSESRSEDFDADFRPLQERTQGRWLSIATARLTGATMPPVQLLQVRDVYYVRDGHHRISVARAMGQEYIEAEVMVMRADGTHEVPRSERFLLGRIATQDHRAGLRT